MKNDDGPNRMILDARIVERTKRNERKIQSSAAEWHNKNVCFVFQKKKQCASLVGGDGGGGGVATHMTDDWGTIGMPRDGLVKWTEFHLPILSAPFICSIHSFSRCQCEQTLFSPTLILFHSIIFI